MNALLKQLSCKVVGHCNSIVCIIDIINIIVITLKLCISLSINRQCKSIVIVVAAVATWIIIVTTLAASVICITAAILGFFLYRFVLLYVAHRA